MSIFWYCGRGLQALMLVGLLVVLAKAGSNPYVAGQLSARIVFHLVVTEVLIRFSQPKQDQPPSGCNVAAAGCLSLLVLGGVAGLILGLKMAMGPGRPELVAHSGPNKSFSLRVPKGAQFKKESRTDSLPQGKVKVNGEIWELRDEGGVVGVADIPLIRTAAASRYTSGNGYYSSYGTNQGLGRALSDDEILDAVCEGQMTAIAAERGPGRAVNRLGYRGREVDLTVPSKKLQGRILYLWGNRRLYFCLYASEQNHWDDARAQSILNSFHFSMVR